MEAVCSQAQVFWLFLVSFFLRAHFIGEAIRTFHTDAETPLPSTQRGLKFVTQTKLKYDVMVNVFIDEKRRFLGSNYF